MENDIKKEAGTEADRIRSENEALRDRIKALEEENEHLKSEVGMATRMKFHLMPNVYPAFPDIPDFDIYADMVAIRQLGGDYYDFYRLDNDHIGIVVADIFDGGTAAALFMVAFKLYMTSQQWIDDDIADKIRNVNESLCFENTDNLSLSAWYGEYEISTGTLVAVNAGHEPPLLLHDGKVVPIPEEKISYLIGVIGGVKYTSYEVKLSDGDKLLLYTDGVTLARSDKGEMFGREHLVSTFENSRNSDSEETVGLLERELSTFIKGCELSEDATFLCISKKGRVRS